MLLRKNKNVFGCNNNDIYRDFFHDNLNHFIVRAPFTSYMKCFRYSSWLAEFKFKVDQG